MTRHQKALTPDEFVAIVVDYAGSDFDESYVRKCYEAQIAAVRYERRDLLSPAEFVAALTANAGVDVSEPDRDRLREAYEQQIDTAEELVGDPRV